ncbi:MAG: hypothetical protein WC783_00735 [Candidatus Paceibacterota bacterium]|jgi:hypothetical protein
MIRYSDYQKDMEFRQQATKAYNKLVSIIENELSFDSKLTDSERFYWTNNGDLMISGYFIGYPDLWIKFIHSGNSYLGTGRNTGSTILGINSLIAPFNPKSLNTRLQRVRFTHEFIHYLDGLRIKKQTISPVQQYNEGGDKPYYNNPKELNAYTQEALNDMDSFFKREQVEKIYTIFFTDISGFITNTFKWFFDKDFIANLTPQNLQRIKKRIAPLYNYYKDSFIRYPHIAKSATSATSGEIIYHTSDMIFENGLPPFKAAYFGTESFNKTFPNEFGKYTYAFILTSFLNILDLNNNSLESRNFMANIAKREYNDQEFFEALIDGDVQAFKDFYDLWMDKTLIFPFLGKYDGIKYEEEYFLPQKTINQLKPITSKNSSLKDLMSKHCQIWKHSECPNPSEWIYNGVQVYKGVDIMKYYTCPTCFSTIAEVLPNNILSK